MAVKHNPTGIVHSGTKGGTTGYGVDTKKHLDHWVHTSDKVTCKNCKK